MRIDYNNSANTLFGQLVPTKELLKVGSGIQNVEDSKNICTACRKKFVGHIGYYKTAINIVETIKQKNKAIKELFDILNTNDTPEKLNAIEKYVAENGRFIDVEL